MKLGRLFLVGLVSLGGLMACGGDSSSDKDKTPGGPDNQESPGNLPLEYQLIDPDSVMQETERGVEGEGSIIFVNPLPSLKSNRHFIVQFQIKKEGGFVDIRTYAKRDLSEGIELRVERLKENTQKTTLAATHVDNTGDDYSDEFSDALDGKMNEVITLRVDVHNAESGGHTIVWKADPGEEVSDTNLIDKSLFSGAAGTGVFWGLKVKDAEILYVEVVDAKDKH